MEIYCYNLLRSSYNELNDMHWPETTYTGNLADTKQVQVYSVYEIFVQLKIDAF